MEYIWWIPLALPFTLILYNLVREISWELPEIQISITEENADEDVIHTRR